MGKTATLGLAPAVFSPLMNITGSLLASYWHKRKVDEDDDAPKKEDFAVKGELEVDGMVS
jgi:BASS family bile acid:Na+ symporter